jgi:uncharacterized protein GlcG (DUF336 family)
MALTRTSLRLNYQGARALLEAAIAYAEKMHVPQCIAVVDDGCNLLAFARMDGSRVLSIDAVIHKAMTAASIGKPTGEFPEQLGQSLGAATGGKMVNLKGGLPVIVDGQTIGGIGVGSGTGDQDREVANAALSTFPGAETFVFS